MKYKRDVINKIRELGKYFPVIALVGPRQAGKTTFLKASFPGYKYFNLEQSESLGLLATNSRHILEENPNGIIFDEVQRLPSLLGEIQAFVDEKGKMGKIIISGSHNLLISEKISQSLSGRVAYCYMYPLSIQELERAGLLKRDAKRVLFEGGYPGLYARKVPPNTFYEQYVSTYLERDVRQLRNVGDTIQFRKFLGLIAGRVGQLVNLSSLANDVGVTHKTISDWLSVLETTFVIWRLPPYYKNLGKRLIKSPKIYFYDTGLLCYLLGLRKREEIDTHYLYGGIFENFVLNEVWKLKRLNNDLGELFFYRDSNGKEIDLIIERSRSTIPVEVKVASYFSPAQIEGNLYWQKISTNAKAGYVITNDKTQTVKEIKMLFWRDLPKIMGEIE